MLMRRVVLMERMMMMLKKEGKGMNGKIRMMKMQRLTRSLMLSLHPTQKRIQIRTQSWTRKIMLHLLKSRTATRLTNLFYRREHV